MRVVFYKRMEEGKCKKEGKHLWINNNKFIVEIKGPVKQGLEYGKAVSLSGMTLKCYEIK